MKLKDILIIVHDIVSHLKLKH